MKMFVKGEVPIPVLANYFRVPYRGGIAVDYPGRDVLLQSKITNISKNGIFIVTGNPLPRGSQFEVSFQLPTTRKLIRAECVVRWSTESARESDSRLQGMGLEFTRIGRRDRKNLERFIKDFLTDMRKRPAGTFIGELPETPVEAVDKAEPGTGVGAPSNLEDSWRSDEELPELEADQVGGGFDGETASQLAPAFDPIDGDYADTQRGEAVSDARGLIESDGSTDVTQTAVRRNPSEGNDTEVNRGFHDSGDTASRGDSVWDAFSDTNPEKKKP